MPSKFTVTPGGTAQGEITVPGDKSISHRSIIFAALANGISHINGFLEGEDCLATLNAFTAMRVNIEHPAAGQLVIHGVGKHGLQIPSHALDLGNSGTSMRLLVGLLAGAAIATELTGDSSLVRRPMGRVTKPLRLMGAEITSTDAGTAPLHIQPNKPLTGIEYTLPVASAQVKSCLLLAGMYARGQTTITEPAITRDHTERMLRAFNYPFEQRGKTITINNEAELTATEINVPGDISSAAFFMVAACIAHEGHLRLRNVGINPTRIGVITILREMGASITLQDERMVGGEPVADIVVEASELKGIVIPEDQVSLAIDEFPVLFVAAACAEGTTVLSGAAELRVKESDRLQVMAVGLQRLGIQAELQPDGIVIQGGTLQGGEVDSHGDHRIAMAFAVAGLRAQGTIVINDCDNVATSFPNFMALAQDVGLAIQ
tara:strand:- start:9640 stop:10938 length:1299 start_codon:yes stop_codon:yes gene_type:complete